MKRPEKKTMTGVLCEYGKGERIGYNLACDVWTKYHHQEMGIVLAHTERLEARIDNLPSEEEIEHIIHSKIKEFTIAHRVFNLSVQEDLAKEIYKRIGK